MCVRTVTLDIGCAHAHGDDQHLTRLICIIIYALCENAPIPALAVLAICVATRRLYAISHA